MSHVRHPTQVEQALAARGDAVDLLERLARRPVRPFGLACSAAAPPLPQMAPQPVAPLASARALPPQRQAGGVGPRRQVWLLVIVIGLAIVTFASVGWAAPRGTAPAPQAPPTAVPGCIHNTCKNGIRVKKQLKSSFLTGILPAYRWPGHTRCPGRATSTPTPLGSPARCQSDRVRLHSR